MNIHRYDTDRRKSWVLDKITRAKTVRQILQEASISRATLYNWIEEFEQDTDLKEAAERYQAPTPREIRKVSRPELLNNVTNETSEKYRMLVSALSGIDHDRVMSKKLVTALIKRFTLSVSQACAIVGMEEQLYGYKPRKPEVEDYIVYEGLVTLVREDRRRGFEELYDLLMEAHPDWTRKQIKRVYRDGMVYLERTRKKHKQTEAAITSATQEAADAPVAAAPVRVVRNGGTWNLALIEDAIISEGQPRPFWLLVIFDEETGLQLNAQTGIGAITTDDVLSFLDRAIMENGNPKKLKVPGKPALTVRELTRWVWEHRMALHTFSLQKPENLAEISRLEQAVRNSVGLEPGIEYPALIAGLESWITAAAVELA